MAQILLLEPDAVLSNIYAEFLERAGHRVNQVFDAQTAIDSADKKPPDLVILELQLPIHNGIEFLYEFRSYIEWKNTPVIVQSFIPPNEFKAAFSVWHKLGVVAYIYKPRARLHQLASTVEEHLATLVA